MLPAAARMRRRAEFTETVRVGSRAATRTLVAHWRPSADDLHVGFVVGRGVGSAVTRNLVRRRLRHLVRARMSALPAGGSLVLRANAAAAGVPASSLSRDLDAVLARAGAARPEPTP